MLTNDVVSFEQPGPDLSNSGDHSAVLTEAEARPFYLFSTLNYKTKQKAKLAAIQVNILLDDHIQAKTAAIILR